MTAFTCAELEARLAESDDAVPGGHDTAAARHLATCPSCRALLADLAAIRAAATRLRDHPVPPAVWPRLAAELRGGRATHRLAWPVSRPWLAAAATLLVAVGAALGVLAMQWGRATSGPAGNDVAQVAADLEAAEAHYQRAIAGLERLARTDDPALDPEVAQVLQANLQAVDRAIRDTRAALAARPDDDVARRSLLDALDGKMALLEQTVSLIDAGRALSDVPAAPR
jgi:hypothetical protein